MAWTRLRPPEPLWIPGLAVLCLAVGHLLFRGPWLDLQGKAYDWAQYVVVGVIFPALLFGLPLLWRWRQWRLPDTAPLERALIGACLVTMAVFLAASAVKYGPWSGILAALLALAQTVLMIRPARAREMWTLRAAAIFLLALIGWVAGFSRHLLDVVQPPVFLAGLAVALLLVSDAARERVVAPSWRLRLRSPANLVALVVIALMSLRTDGLFEVLGERGAIHHMGAWVGAADLVREGHWLLWDAPSNYGSLNVLAFAVIPTATPWQSFYLLQALAFFIVSGGLFLLMRALGPGLLNWCFAMAMAIGIVMFTPTFDAATPVRANFILPNWGAYRYLWAFVLVLLLVWERRTPERSARHAGILVVGCFAWLIGVLWSPESAFFSSGAWLPAYLAILLRSGIKGTISWRRAAAWLLLPALLLAGALAFVAAIFAIPLGHAPDWASYFDYAVEVGLNVLVVTQEPLGPAVALLLGFCLLAMGGYYAGLRRGLPTRSFALWIGLLGAFWAASSYGYQRGSPLFHPVACAALGLLLVLAAQQPHAAWSALARAGTVPLLVVTLASPLAAVAADPLAVRGAAASLLTTAQHRFAIEYLIPDAPGELQALMAEAGVQADDPIFYAADYLGNLLLPWRPGGAGDGERVIAGRHWTPGHPALALRWIPPGRGEVYTRRYIERAPQSGWLIQGKTGVGASADFAAFAGGLEPWFFDLVRETHVPTRIYQSEHWQVVWFEYVGDAPGVPRPDYAWGQLGRLPPDVWLDGIPLSQAPHPQLWTVFGEHWGLFDPDRASRAMANRAVLWLYSPDASTVQLRLTPAAAPPGAMLSIANDDRVVSAPEPLLAGQVSSASLPLHSGWNALTLTIELPAAKSTKPKEDRQHLHDRAAKDAPAASSVSPSATPAAPASPAAGKAKWLSVRRIEIVTNAD